MNFALKVIHYFHVICMRYVVKIAKTNAVRALDRAKIAYELMSYTVDESDLSATHLAEKAGLDVACVYKTLVMQGDRSGYFVCLLAGDAAVDLKKAAKVSGNKSCSLLPVKDLLPLTGYIRGGCSPLAMKKAFPTYIDESAKNVPRIYVNAGQRGLQIYLDPADLVRITNGEWAGLTADAEGATR